jgi:N-acetylglucosamine kinase-like BadF-type ATPase
MTQQDALNIIETKYILGVDGGGTKTEAIAYALDGSEISRGYAGLGNILIDKNLALNNIQLAILECVKKLSLDNCMYLCLGLAGCEAGGNKAVIQQYLKKKFNCPIKVINDGELAIKGSIITKIHIVKDEFINELRINNIENKLYDEDVSSAKGAYYLGIKACCR